jgi:hypothetical protein
MGFLTKLFGDSKRASLKDTDLGDFTELSHNGDKFIWKGQVEIFNETISLYMSGNSSYLEMVEKTILFDILKNEATVESEANKALLEQYEEANKHYSSWQVHFNCIRISTIGGGEISITFEEKESRYHFNVFFLDCKTTGVLIDS